MTLSLFLGIRKKIQRSHVRKSFAVQFSCMQFGPRYTVCFHEGLDQLYNYMYMSRACQEQACC